MLAFFWGGGEEDPTPKLVIANGALSPLSYPPALFSNTGPPGVLNPYWF